MMWAQLGNWVVHFSSGDRPRSWRPCTIVSPWNEERLDQDICVNRWITTRGLCTELSVSFNALETMLATLQYRKVCARWVPRMLTQVHKDQRMQDCQDLLNQYEPEGGGYLDSITGDETWCHRCESESKRHSMQWRHANSPSKKKFKGAMEGNCWASQDPSWVVELLQKMKLLIMQFSQVPLYFLPDDNRDGSSNISNF
jgi:histone-lysine N-methyltransferase SETMAR